MQAAGAVLQKGMAQKECAHIEAFQNNYAQRLLQQDIEQDRQILNVKYLPVFVLFTQF